MLTNFILASLLIGVSIVSLLIIDKAASTFIHILENSSENAKKIKKLSEHLSVAYHEYQKSINNIHCIKN